MQLFTLGKAFDSGQLGTVAHHRQRQAGIHPLAVEQHGAGTALAVVTAFLRADQVQLFPQQIQQGGPGQDLKLTRPAIERQTQWMAGI